MPEISRTILVIDQASAALRVADDRVVGLDMHPAAARWLTQEATAGRDTVLVLPTSDDPGGAASAGAGLTDRLELAGRLALSVGAARVVTTGPELTGIGESVLADVPTEDRGAGVIAFVSADRSLRGQARAAGLLPVAHPALLPLVASGEPVVAARFAGPRSVLERFAGAQGLVPMHFQPTDDPATWALIGLCPSAALTDAVVRRLRVTPLDCDPGVDDLVWVRPDESTAAISAGLAGRRILYAEPGRVLIALGPDETSDALRLHGAHGHTELLVPDPGLLQPALTEPESTFTETFFGTPSPILEDVVIDPAIRRRIELTRPLCSIMSQGYATRLDRYTGVAPLDAAGPIISRHISHPDNKRVEAQLLADLRAMGYCPWRHDFLHNGVKHSNVIADLPGTGWFRIKLDLLERLRRILADGDRNDVVGELRSLRDQAGITAEPLDDLPDMELRRELERIVGLEPWNPWWRLRCPMAGFGAGLVIVGAHLDSTAGFDSGYHPATDPAPGRDDNGSGLAAVLTLAQYFRSLAGKLTHTVRLCFFNAEEAGLVGSKAYAAQLKAQRAPVREVFCTDMMGYNSDSSRIFELHAGYPDPVIRDRSTPLADRVAAAAAAFGSLLPAQIYRGTSLSGAPDRDVYDGAINRSDHAAFQQQGWGAVLASEDFFVNRPGEPAADANPNYHRAADQITDTSFARAITCAVGRAATLAAL